MIEKKKSLLNNSSIKSKILSELKDIILKNKIPNALLFTGCNINFLNKSAINFAKAVNCLHPLGKSFFEIPCNECISCKKIAAEMHPDITLVKPEDQTIKISFIRDLFKLITSKPNEAKMRCIIIENAETMNIQAQNAFLKMLEEPPSKTFFILITENTNPLLATIISRCRNIWFKPSQDNDIGIASSQEESTVDWSERRKWLLNEIGNLIYSNKKDRFKRLKPLLLAEKLSCEPELLKDSFTVIRTFLRDLAVIRYSPEKIINIDYLHVLTKISEKLSMRKNLLFFKELHNTENKNQKHPSSIRINLEALFLRISSGEA